ncbi:MAG: chromate transporter [Planctomycetes bacterium GWF2_41_51]|nr:MAG: chromate transporter [Planctomycetes bacterium GWF2_41_51]HBG28796.1 chromate transporter [Phycisphaerales bacterium]
MSKITEIAKLFLKLGTIAFGGPAAHIAMMHNETVEKRKWLDDQQFLDLIGATNLIPGPNSTEMAIHIGFLRAGWRGLIVGGLCFAAPAIVIVLFLAWLYSLYGTLPSVQWLLYGVKPVVIAIILQALWQLGRKAIKDTLTATMALIVFVLYFMNVNEIFLLFAGGFIVMLVKNIRQLQKSTKCISLVPLGGIGILSQTINFNLPMLFFIFLKIGAVWYGSGYVLLAFLRSDFVERLGWLTDQQLLDAIAIGQVTPGPLFTTATFIGFLLGGFKGAVLATLGIFLPSFIFVAISNPLIPRLRKSPWAGALLDGINAAALSLMAAVTWQLGTDSLINIYAILIFVISFILLIRFKINSTWLIAAGALIGLLNAAFH